MDDPTNPIPTAVFVKTKNNILDLDKNRSTTVNSTHLEKTECAEDYRCINKQFSAIHPEKGHEDSDSTTCLSSNTIDNDVNICSTSRNITSPVKYDNLAVSSNDNYWNPNGCKNKRNRKQFKTVRAFNENNKEEKITTELGEIKHKNICKKVVNEIFLANSNDNELLTEPNKDPANILENLHTINKTDQEILKTDEIIGTEIYENKFTSNTCITQQKVESDDFETIDKIADMIANTENVKKDMPRILNESNPTGVYSNNNINNIAKKLTNTKKWVEPTSKPSFEEVETRLEQMFAGIEDEAVTDMVQPAPYHTNTENSVKEDCITNNHIAFNITPSVEVYKNEVIAQKRLYSPKNYPNKKKRKIVKKSFNLKANKPLENKIKSKIVKEETVLTDKYKGPYIQLNSEGVINVINAPLSEEYSEKRNKIKKLILNYTKAERNKILGLHVSTLSTKYDADTTDTSWLCFFCKKGPHKTAQGDLFGPYIVNTNCEEFRMSQSHLQNVLEIQRVRTEMYQKDIHRFPIVPSILSNVNKFRNEYKQSRKGFVDENTPKINNEIFLGMVKVSDTSYEVWVHEDCIIWASGIYLIGSKIIGLESAVWRSTINICSICSTNGAIVCCLQRECKQMSHIACAKSENWTVSEHDFKSYCKNHSDRALL